MSKDNHLQDMYLKISDEYREIFLGYLKKLRQQMRVADLEDDSLRTVQDAIKASEKEASGEPNLNK